MSKTEKVVPRGKRLHIKSVSPMDNGVYRCIVSNEAGSIESIKNFALNIPGNVQRRQFILEVYLTKINNVYLSHCRK